MEQAWILWFAVPLQWCHQADQFNRAWRRQIGNICRKTSFMILCTAGFAWAADWINPKKRFWIPRCNFSDSQLKIIYHVISIFIHQKCQPNVSKISWINSVLNCVPFNFLPRLKCLHQFELGTFSVSGSRVNIWDSFSELFPFCHRKAIGFSDSPNFSHNVNRIQLECIECS